MTPLPHRPVRAPRVAALVADVLRERILAADMLDGDYLPKEDAMRAEFEVGKPAIREALRILETEGLLHVVRGNHGGAIIHKPRADGTAYTIGLALVARGVQASDVGLAIRAIEPVCAAECAKRVDRIDVVVPVLRELVAQSRASLADPAALSSLARQFHEGLVRRCGNETLAVVAGALEGLWSCHVARSTADAADSGPRSSDELRLSIAEHARITDLIEIGDHEGARDAVVNHLERVQTKGATAGTDVPIDLATLRARLQP